MSVDPKIVLLSGGVGGAKFAEGLYHSRYSKNLSIIGNVADDQEFHGLWVSPDIDTLTYTLADVIDKNQGWGLSGETNHTLDALNRLGADTWMYLGDQDFATHIYRTQQRKLGIRPSLIAKHIAKRLGVKADILLPTDDIIQNQICTEKGRQDFQTYFVKDRCQGDVLDTNIVGIENASATPEALSAIANADLVLIAPSNPIVSINPILQIEGIGQEVKSSAAPVVAISPLIAGETVKGPADKMMLASGLRSDAKGVADFYQGYVDTLIIDSADKELAEEIQQNGLDVFVSNTLMTCRQSKVDLAEFVVRTALETSRLAEVV